MADVGKTGRTDSASRLIQASPETLYGAFSDGETLMEWLPPETMTGRALDYAFRPGGSYRVELRYRDGEGVGKTTGDTDISKGRFIALIPNREIRQTVEFESEDTALAGRMTMIWKFEPKQDGTEVNVTAEGVPPAIGKEDHMKGLNGSLANLARFVERS